MAESVCPKCGLRLKVKNGKFCAECLRDASERKLLVFALIVPFVLAIAVVLTGLPL